jgi:hypothetical protein
VTFSGGAVEMNGIRPVGNRLNLPENQQFTQRLADQFNADERLWMSLEPMRLLCRALHPRMNRWNPEKLELVDFVRAQPPKDCLALWRIG